MLPTVHKPGSGRPRLRARRDRASSGQKETASPEPRRPGPDDQTETLPPERLQRARETFQAYHRWLRLSRLSLLAFVLLAALFLVWAVPWLPSGLDVDDYTPELAFTVYLLGGAALAGIIALGLRELAQRNRESLMLWATVYDEATGLHNRTYLYDRLSLECERAKRRGSVFSVIVLHIRIAGAPSRSSPALSNAAPQKVAELLNRLLRPSDLVALLSSSELGILAVGLNREHRQAIVDRLRHTLAEELPGLLDKSVMVSVKGGVATYGEDGNDPGTLLQAARTSVVLARPDRSLAA